MQKYFKICRKNQQKSRKTHEVTGRQLNWSNNGPEEAHFHDPDLRELSMLPVISVSCLVQVKTTYNKDPHKLEWNITALLLHTLQCRWHRSCSEWYLTCSHFTSVTIRESSSCLTSLSLLLETHSILKTVFINTGTFSNKVETAHLENCQYNTITALHKYL